jgi:predicted DNA-binding transcriptional regulator YafY
MNRIDRLHAILTHLQSKKKVTAQDIADRFNISLRTVYRDVKALEESGVPVIGEAGIGYSIMEGYRLPPVMFTQEEASALLMGSKLAEKFADNSVRKHFDSALYKIKAVLRTSDKEHVELLDSHITVMASRLPLSDELSKQHLSTLQSAMVHKRVIQINYLSTYKEENTLRQIEPIGLCYYGINWHLIGWCRLRKDYRDFRLDRINRLVVLDETFSFDSHPSVQEYINTVTCNSELVEITVLFDKEVGKYIQSEKYFHGFVSEQQEGNRIRMKFLTSHVDSFGRWLLMFTNNVQVESPASLQDILQQFTNELAAHYQPSDYSVPG